MNNKEVGEPKSTRIIWRTHLWEYIRRTALDKVDGLSHLASLKRYPFPVRNVADMRKQWGIDD